MMLADDDFAVLNAIYLKKMATAGALVEVAGLPLAAVEQCLGAAVDAGWVLNMPTGALLLEEGTRAVLATYQQAYEATRQQPEVRAWYDAFEVINARFIGQVTDWQQTGGDERVEGKLLQTAERLARDIRALLPWVPRYAHYVDRIRRAMEKVDQGQRDFVCKPTVDSVHNIWFEFHEDILAVLGRPRDTT